MKEFPQSEPRSAKLLQYTILALTFVLYCAYIERSRDQLSPAFDEAAHIRSGLGMVSAGAYVDPDSAWWSAIDPLHPPADVFPALLATLAGQSPDLRRDANVPFTSILAARWANHLLGAVIVLCLLVCGKRRFGLAGMLAATVATLGNPLFMAHSLIVSSDLYMLAGALLISWSLWRVARLESPDSMPKRYAAATVLALITALGICLKLSNLLFLPLLPAVCLYTDLWTYRSQTVGAAPRAVTVQNFRKLFQAMLRAGYCAVLALVMAAAIYQLAFQGIRQTLPSPWQLPLGFGAKLYHAIAITRGLHGSFSQIYWFGEFTSGSFLHYVVFLGARTPFVALVAIVLSLPLVFSRRAIPSAKFISGLAWASGLFLATRGFYFGLRHLIFPITAAIFSAGGIPALRPGSAATHPRQLPWGVATVVLALVVWQNALTAPWYLSYVNPLAEGELTFAADGDWGQGLLALRTYQDEALADQDLWLSYFGSVPPEQLGISYRGLRTAFNSHSFDKAGKRYFDPQRASGVVAISAANLAGRYLPSVGIDPNYFAAWRDREPLKVVGGTIFIFAPAAGMKP